MAKTIFEEMGGTYRQVGDYLLPDITVPAEEEAEPIGLWGQRHARHLKEHHKVLYMNLLTSGKLYRYLVDVDRQAGDMFLRLVKEYADRQGVTEQLKAENPHEWIGRMNNIQACVREVVEREIIYVYALGGTMPLHLQGLLLMNMVRKIEFLNDWMYNWEVKIEFSLVYR